MSQNDILMRSLFLLLWSVSWENLNTSETSFPHTTRTRYEGGLQQCFLLKSTHHTLKPPSVTDPVDWCQEDCTLVQCTGVQLIKFLLCILLVKGALEGLCSLMGPKIQMCMKAFRMQNCRSLQRKVSHLLKVYFDGKITLLKWSVWRLVSFCVT